MFTNTKLVSGLVSKIRNVEKQTLEALAARRVEQEPAVTDRLLGVMEQTLNDQNIGGITWTAKTLTDRGRGSQEAKFGADFMAVFRVSIPGFEVAKGFMAQSKLLEPSDNFSRSDSKALRQQCERMLKFSPASYAFVYSQQKGIVVVPAVEVLAARDCNPHELTSLPMSEFYRQHFECFIGDRSIKTADPGGLEGLRAQADARSVFLLNGGPQAQGQGTS
ncbi:MAG: hypothetical protein GC172_05605 [Phycisphaera sp.]|nr:hypothetical protein [Phycisphaera sp.]